MLTSGGVTLDGITGVLGLQRLWHQVGRRHREYGINRGEAVL